MGEGKGDNCAVDTWVTEEWDARKSPRRLVMRLMRSRNAAAIERTLANLDAHLTIRA